MKVMNSIKRYLGFMAMVLLVGYTGAAKPQSATENDSVAEADLGSPVVRHDTQPLSLRSTLVFHVLAGELAGKRGRYDLAMEHYITAAQLSPNPRLAERAVNISLFVEDNEAALVAARRWQELEPEGLNSRQALALALLRNGQVDDAVEHLDALRQAAAGDGQEGFGAINGLLSQVEDKKTVFQALTWLADRHSQSRFARYFHAFAALELKNFDQALASLEKVLALAPDWGPAYLLRAQVRLEREQQKLALEELAAAVARLPKERGLRSGYARLLVNGGRLDEAREQFELLAEQAPDDAEPRFALGLLAAQFEDYDLAEKYFRDVLERGARVVDTYYELGKIEELRGNFSKAREWYGRVTAGERYLGAQIRIGAMLSKERAFQTLETHFAVLRRDHPHLAASLYLAEAELLREAGRFQATHQLLSEALADDPDNHELLYARALVAEKLDRLDWLEADLKVIIEADPENGHALNALGYTLADRTDRYQEALGYLERAVALLPEDAAVLDSMGWVHFHLRRYDQALDYLRRAYERSQDAEIAAHLSEVLWASGQPDEARQIWRQAVEKDPDSPYLLKVKERLQL